MNDIISPDVVVEISEKGRPDFGQGDPLADDRDQQKKPPPPSRLNRVRMKRSTKNLLGNRILVEQGMEPTYTTSEAAEFFDKTSQWLYWGERNDFFTDEDGNPIRPERVGGRSRPRRRFTLTTLKEITKSCYRRGSMDRDKLFIVLHRIALAEQGVEWRSREGWRYTHLTGNRYRWVRPEFAEWDPRNSQWRLKQKGGGEFEQGDGEDDHAVDE